MKKLIIFALVATVGINFSCSESFLEVEPQGAASLTSLSNKSGVNATLIGAYSLLDGVGAGNTGRQSTISNYVFGGITSGDAVKGTDAGDQPEQSFIEISTAGTAAVADTGLYLAALVPEYFSCPPSAKVSAIQVSAGGTLYVTPFA